MRILSHFIVLALATIGLISHVDASCQGGPSDTDIPDANALTLFVTSTSILTGDFIHFGHGITGSTGLSAADQVCTYYATNPTGTTIQGQTASKSGTQPYYNQDANGNTVQFRAILSTDSVNAIDRFADISNINIVDAKTRKCLASNINDLFAGSNGLGYPYSREHLFTEAGVTFSVDTQVWTGTGAILSDNSKVTADTPGGRFHLPGKSISSSQGFCYNQNLGQSWSNSSVAANGAVGIIVINAPTDAKNYWIYDQNTPNGLACSQGVRLYCLSAQPFNPPATPTPNVAGDPQFIGLQGQSFQVHGMPDEFFNLITTPEFQLNSRFTYLASGICNYNNTECWSHPGTYVDQLGFMFPGLYLATIAGSHVNGMTVIVNDKRLEVSSQSHTYIIKNHHHHHNHSHTVSITYQTYDQLIVTTPLFTITITNSDLFFNFAVSFHSHSLLSIGSTLHHITSSSPSPYPSFPLHGLLGQTWKNARYEYGRMYQGEVDDYMLTDGILFSTKFVFNQYQH